MKFVVLRKRAFSDSSPHRQARSIFASSNRYFTENNRWVPPIEPCISIIMIREKQQKTLVYIFRVRYKGIQKPFKRKKNPTCI